MKYTFESLQDENLMDGSSYFMDFGEMESQEDAAIAEGKLLSAFGQPTGFPHSIPLSGSRFRDCSKQSCL